MINAAVTVTHATITAADVVTAVVSTEQAAIATATCLLLLLAQFMLPLMLLNANILQVKICIPV